MGGKSFKKYMASQRRVRELEGIVAGKDLLIVNLETELNPPIPEFKKWGIQRSGFVNKLLTKGIEAVEIDDRLILNAWYWYTTLESWGELLLDLVINAEFYQQDIFACDGYAFDAQTECAKRYRMNSLRTCFHIKTTDGGEKAHAYNLFPYGDQTGLEGIMLFEPNEGYEWSGVMEFGDFDYRPHKVLV